MKIQPPMKEPTTPRMMSVMQPKPRPREIFPASHPAMRPMTIQPQNPLGSAIQKPFVSKRTLNRVADIRPPRKFSFASGLVMRRSLSDGLLFRHAVKRSESEDQIAAGDADNFPGGGESRARIEGCPIVFSVNSRDGRDFFCFV